MPDTPETQFQWHVNDQLHAAAPRNDARRYAYQDAKTPVPTPRPGNDAPRAPRSSTVTQSALPPVSRTTSAYDSGMAFAWPVNGTVIANFGSTENGGRNDGINIATQLHAPIRASASGTVTYSGNELKDYGNLLLIKHKDGYVTAYAHADSLLVSRGDTVTKGQIIGYAGETGDVTSPQLHFEIRHGTAPVNPRPLLVASASDS
jgi:murein DD-endopeptidase MepM/ murein hydrolase activator NlpD